MKTSGRLISTSITLGLLSFALGCSSNSGSGLSAIRSPVAQKPLIVPQNQLPGIPGAQSGGNMGARIGGTIVGGGRGGHGGKPSAPSSGTDVNDGDGNDHSSGGGSDDSSDISSHASSSTPQTPATPATLPSSDPRDGGRRLDDPTCASFRALTGRWTITVDDKWSVINKDSNKWVKNKIEKLAPGFFSDSLCQGLQTLRTLNARVAKQIEQKIGAKQLQIVLSGDAEVGEYDQHRHILHIGGPQIKLGRRVMEGVIAATMTPADALLLAPKDSELALEPKANQQDILDNQVMAAKATFFHYLMHMAGATVDKKKHTNDSFAQNAKELDVIDACTAQVFPYFYVDADYLDYQGKTDVGPFYTNSNLACLTCATADVYASGEIFATIKQANPTVTADISALCGTVRADANGHDPDAVVTPDRSGNLYEEMK